MGARIRAELRGRWRATLGLALLVGLVGGIAIAAAAGARRTASAYPRFLEESNAADILVNPDLGLFTDLDFDAVAALPEVASMGTVAGMVVTFPGPDGEPVLDGSLPVSLAPLDDRTFATLERPQLLAGRLPDPSRPDEAFVNPALADQRDLGPGDALDVLVAPTEELYAAEESGLPLPPFEARRLSITGIGVGGDEIVTDEAFADDGKLGLTPAFYRQHPDAVIFWGLFVDLERGATDIASFRAGVERLAGDEAVEFQSATVTTTTVQRAIRPQAVALALFAALAGLAGALVTAQALARQLGVDADDALALHAIGMSRRQRLAVALARVSLVGVVGAAVAVVVAVAASPLFPIGPARFAEPDPGVAIDPLALGLGAAGLLVAVVACSIVPAWRSSSVRSMRPAVEGGGRSSRLADALSRWGVRLPAVIGVKLALEPGRGRTSVATRSALVGASVAVASVVAAVTFAASLDHLLGTPRLYGWDWDVMIEGGDGSEEAGAEALGAIADQLAADPVVTALSVGNVGRLVLAGSPVPAVGVEPIRGAVSPTIVSGRAPIDDHEIALGSRTMQRLDLTVGDNIAAEVSGSGATQALEVVGQAVFPNFATYSGSDNTELGLGALVTTASLARLGPEFTKPFLLVDLAQEADSAAGLLDADEEGLLALIDAPQLPADAVNFDRVRETPLALAALLAVLAFATVTHTLVTSVRRRQRDLALIRSLGFLRRQVSATIAWQATTVAALSLLAGLPLGVAVGRWAWTLLAGGLGIPPEPITPLIAVALAIPAVLVVANLVAAIPARAAGRIRPAVALRSE